MYSYDLGADVVVDGEHFDLTTAEMRVRNQKQFLHPALSYADHDMMEYVFARRVYRRRALPNWSGWSSSVTISPTSGSTATKNTTAPTSPSRSLPTESRTTSPRSSTGSATGRS